MVGSSLKFFVWFLYSVFAFKYFYCTIDTQFTENENNFYMFSLEFGYYSKDRWQFCNFLHKLTGSILVNKRTTLFLFLTKLNGHETHLLQTHLLPLVFAESLCFLWSHAHRLSIQIWVLCYVFLCFSLYLSVFSRNDLGFLRLLYSLFCNLQNPLVSVSLWVFGDNFALGFGVFLFVLFFIPLFLYVFSLLFTRNDLGVHKLARGRPHGSTS